MSAPVKAIFFDVGNTLLFPDRTHILAPLHQRKLTPTLEQWHAIERRTKKEFDEILQHDGKADQSYWYLFYSHLLQELGVHDDGLRDSLVNATRVSANWRDIRPARAIVCCGWDCATRSQSSPMPTARLPTFWNGAGSPIASSPSPTRDWSDTRSRTQPFSKPPCAQCTPLRNRVFT